MEYSTTRTRDRLLTSTALAGVLAATITTVTATAQAAAVTCHGQAATVVGPTEGGSTTGTEGDDVIVAPIGSSGFVRGLGGNDTICLVNGPAPHVRDPVLMVYAGQGNDAVYNETTEARYPLVELGSGQDTYLGSDYSESVRGGALLDATGGGPDTEVDVIDTRGGKDSVSSGSDAPGVENHDVISTGAGHDLVGYSGAAGGTVDNGPGADTLYLATASTGALTIDNAARRATVGEETALTWTAVRAFHTSVGTGRSVSFVGTDAAERLGITGSVRDLVSPTATIATRGGDDRVRLENYLPRSVDTGAGHDRLEYLACDRAYVELDVAAFCITDQGAEVDTDLAGIERLDGMSLDVFNVRGTKRAERITASAPFVMVRSLEGADRVSVSARTVEVYGGRGADTLEVRGPDGTIVRGGRGDDLLRGDKGRDELYGGRGKDAAYGRDGNDLCVAEVRVGCERP